MGQVCPEGLNIFSRYSNYGGGLLGNGRIQKPGTHKNGNSVQPPCFSMQDSASYF